MAKKKSKPIETHSLSLEQLMEEDSSRSLLKCTPSLDIALGGGIPMGCTVLVGGHPKLGKTTLALQYAAYGQKHFGSKVFFFDIEGRLKNLVVQQVQGLMRDIDHFEIIQPEQVKNAKGQIVGYKTLSAEQWWKIIGNTIEENHDSIIIVDSIANLSTASEQSEGMGYQGRGNQQKIEAQFCRQYGNAVRPSNVTLFLLTQVQANTSGYGSSISLKVGNHIKHQADTVLFGKWAEKWQEDPRTSRVLGHNMHYVIETSALGPPHVKVKVPLYYGYGIDRIKDICDFATTWGMIQAGGAWYKLPFLKKDEKDSKKVHKFVNLNDISADKDIEPVKLQGATKMRNWFLTRPKELAILEEKINKKIFG